jgi:hypothetical protein
LITIRVSFYISFFIFLSYRGFLFQPKTDKHQILPN